MQIQIYLVVEPTHLKNMLVNLDHFPNFRGENKKSLKPPPRNPLKRMQRTIVVTSFSPTRYNFRNGWNPKNHPNWTGKSSEPSSSMFGFHCVHFPGCIFPSKNETPSGSKLLKMQLSKIPSQSLICNLWNLKMLPWNRRCYFGKALFLRSMLNCWSVYLSHFWGWI